MITCNQEINEKEFTKTQNKETLMSNSENPISQDQFENLFDDQPKILNDKLSDQAKSKSVDPSPKMKLTTSQYPLHKDLV